MPNYKYTDDDIPESMPSEQVAFLLARTVSVTISRRFQFIIPEATLYCLLSDEDLIEAFNTQGVSASDLKNKVEAYLDTVEKVPSNKKMVQPTPSKMFNEMFGLANDFAITEGSAPLLYHYFGALYSLDGTMASKLMKQSITKRKFDLILEEFADECHDRYENHRQTVLEENEGNQLVKDMHTYNAAKKKSALPTNSGYENAPDQPQEYDDACRRIDTDPAYADAPFEGRELEIKRALTTLGKRSRAHVVFVGDNGVGKSSMITGLIKATAKLKKRTTFGGAHFYKLNVAELVTGMAYADEVENRISAIIEDLEEMPGVEGRMAILFADNMAELMPQSPNDSTPDTLRLLLSLTENTNIRIVTTASFELYKRLASHNSVVAKNFCRIDITEPPLDPDARAMVKTASDDLFAYHNVSCDNTTLDKIIDAAATSYGKELAMPGRAINLIDQLCATIDLQRSEKGSKVSPVITLETLDRLSKLMGYDTIASQATSTESLRGIEPAILSKVFGQDEAVHNVAESVLLAKAGLSDSTKPLAAYLFVGPTGVGKTELAKVLAAQLGTKLVRFDMSEYSEQHTVSKLVGSPAGYIGYDDGGLLTDAVRKNPNCVLLFDEIEKAHSAVFNLLLQVLDYAQLTDNKGQKADFSGTIIIMTSNAGARFATGSGLGYGTKSEKSEVMGSALKKTFAPEFLNRLTQIVAFHDMTLPMAEKILDRKIEELNALIKKNKNITFTLTDEARKFLLEKGYSSHYGAREMDRAIGSYLKPVLMNEILFGGIGEGAEITVDAENETLKVRK